MQGRGRKLIGTFSATDLRGCHLATLHTWLPLSAMKFAETISCSPVNAASNATTPARVTVSCEAEAPLCEVIDMVVTKHVHRVWVVDSQDSLVGLVSLTDIIRVVRASLLSHTSRGNM